MKIKYESSKEVKYWSDFILNPTDRKSKSAFSKHFGSELMSPAMKLHQRLMNYQNVGEYNADFGRTDNRIELKQGVKDKDFLVLKVRVNYSYRKFFYQLLEDSDELRLMRDWNGNFDEIPTILVFDINKHKYDKV